MPGQHVLRLSYGSAGRPSAHRFARTGPGHAPPHRPVRYRLRVGVGVVVGAERPNHAQAGHEVAPGRPGAQRRGSPASPCPGPASPRRTCRGDTVEGLHDAANFRANVNRANVAGGRRGPLASNTSRIHGGGATAGYRPPAGRSTRSASPPSSTTGFRKSHSCGFRSRSRQKWSHERHAPLQQPKAPARGGGFQRSSQHRLSAAAGSLAAVVSVASRFRRLGLPGQDRFLSP